MIFKLPKAVFRGYSIIELLIVVVIMGFLAALVIPSFSNFQQNQDLKLSAEEMRSNIRLAQSRSLSGSKGQTCLATDTLMGWYVSARSGIGQNTYTIGGVCKRLPNTIVGFNVETKSTKNTKVYISDIRVGGVSYASQMFGVFAPVTGKVNYYQTSMSTTPLAAGQNVEITMTNSSISDATDNTAKVVITGSGEVYVTK